MTLTYTLTFLNKNKQYVYLDYLEFAYKLRLQAKGNFQTTSIKIKKIKANQKITTQKVSLHSYVILQIFEYTYSALNRLLNILKN